MIVVVFCRILDFNHIIGDLRMPNISCQYSKIKLISLLYNNITDFYPAKDTTSCFTESRILSDNKIFLAENPICKNQKFESKNVTTNMSIQCIITYRR